MHYLFLFSLYGLVAGLLLDLLLLIGGCLTLHGSNRYERFISALEEASRDVLPIVKDKAVKVSIFIYFSAVTSLISLLLLSS